MQIIDLFSGIGGSSLAGKWIGWHTIQFCEIDLFCQKILSHHFPNIPIHSDIKTLKAKDIIYDKNEKTIITGGFPCQPYSISGKRKGTEDDRHLWPEMLRIIRTFRPDYIVGENVRGFTNWNGGMVFDQVLSDLEKEEYETISFLLPAVSVNAPHRRDRIWIVAKRKSNVIENPLFSGCLHGEYEQEGTGIREQRNIGAGGSERIHLQEEIITNPCNTGLQGSELDRTSGEGKGGKQTFRPTSKFHQIPDWRNFPTTQPTFCTGNDGLPDKLDGITLPKWRNESIKAYGNAWVSQVAYQIFKAIEEYDKTTMD